MIAKAGARYTKEGPCIKGNLDPKFVCNSVVIPDTKSTVDTTAEVSSYTHKHIRKHYLIINKFTKTYVQKGNSVNKFCLDKLIEEESNNAN